MGNNLFRLTDEQQIRYVAKLCSMNENADLKELPTATLRGLIRKSEDYTYKFLLNEIRKLTGKPTR